MLGCYTAEGDEVKNMEIPSKCKVNIAICTSGIGLGFYVPGVVLRNKIVSINSGMVKVYVYEGLLINSKQDDIPKIKQVFQNNFKVALLSQKLVGATNHGIDEEKKKSWFKELEENEVSKIICFSGFWIPLISEYVENHCNVLVDLCHVDCVCSTSWMKFKSNEEKYREFFFNNWETKSVDFYIPFSDYPSTPFEKRNMSLVIHGGGWGLGEFCDVVEEVEKHHFATHIILNQSNKLKSNQTRNIYSIDMKWNAWVKDKSGDYSLPPLSKLLSDGTWTLLDNENIPASYNIIEKSVAIISKPGGGTLLDSFSSCTPLIFLTPYGEYEKKNGQLWEMLGFGIPYSSWKESGFSFDILKIMCRNICKYRERAINYVDYCL